MQESIINCHKQEFIKICFLTSNPEFTIFRIHSTYVVELCIIIIVNVMKYYFDVSVTRNKI